MKKLGLFFVCVFALLVVGCFWGEVWNCTEITIINNSSYNLNISFEYIYYSGHKSEVYLLKTESGFIKNVGIGHGTMNPNNEIVNIKFLDIDTGNIIKEMGTGEGLFEFLRLEEKRMEYDAFYQFIITDALLL